MEIAVSRPASFSVAPSAARRWSGRIVSGVTVLFLLADTAMHLANIAPVQQASTRLGLPVGLAPVFGVIELICLATYLVPRTAVLGAVLLTGYLGGAVAIHLRAGSSLFAEALFPIYVGVLVWGGLMLRRPGLVTKLLRD